MRFYVCRRIKLLSFLQDRGFKHIMQQKDKTNPKYFVWIFTDSPELRSAIEDYYNDDNHLQATK